MRQALGLAVVVLVAGPIGLWGQTAAVKYPIQQDVATLSGIVRAFYEVASGPAGVVPNRARAESLHAVGARVGTAQTAPDGKASVQMLTLKAYQDRAKAPRPRAIYYSELNRVTHQFGNVAQVWSTFATSGTSNGPPDSRGINSVQLYFDGTRWWIIGWITDIERAGNPIPPEFLPKPVKGR